jgi:hypothetical protein
MTYSVILSEAKNLSSMEVQENKQREILRFAQNDNILVFPQPGQLVWFEVAPT